MMLTFLTKLALIIIVSYHGILINTINNCPQIHEYGNIIKQFTDTALVSKWAFLQYR